MTTNLLLRNTAFVCALMLGITSMAQETRIYNPSGKQIPNVSFESSHHNSLREVLFEKAKKAPCLTEGNQFTVTINLEYDEDLFWPPEYAVFINPNNVTNPYAFCWDNGDGTLEGQILAGTYDMIVDFWGYYVILEQVEIYSDLTLTVNPAVCTNLITTMNYGPDGELLKHGLGHSDEVTGEWIIDEESDIVATLVNDVIYLKGFGNLISTSDLFVGEMNSEEERTCPKDIYVNDVSDRFLFSQSRIVFTNDKSKAYCCYFSTDDVKNGVRENDPNNYVYYINKYKYTPYGLTQNGYGKHIALWCIDNNNGVSKSECNEKHFEPKQGYVFQSDIWANVPDVDPNCNEIKIMLQQGFADYEGLFTYPWNGEEYTDMAGWTLGIPTQIQDSQNNIINFGHHKLSTNEGITINDLYNNSSMKPQLWPAPEAFCYPAEQTLGIIGDNSPINALKVETYENNDQMYLGITNYFVGRYGETRWCNEGTTAATKFNGTEVDLESFTPEGKGNYEITITYPNIEVDGLPGYNTTTVYFDQNQEDMTPPSIEMLHFKNGEGCITDRFATSTDGTMEFYTSDFDYHYYPELWNGIFEIKPVDVQVEYAPYGTKSWNELIVEEVPELFQEPGWGYFYRGSLANVTGQAEKGWFDLKFRFEDAAGNWQEQVVSPAFRIDDLAITGINEITLAHPNDDNTIYNLAGQRVHGDINNLPRGVYIVGGKKVVK